ncbi:MAG: hypothetical protein QOJ73_1867, partial [Streptosporangiaceae bacterium]|nr:hypothetical protein [Streptosporangiaceae bacterium]
MTASPRIARHAMAGAALTCLAALAAACGTSSPSAAPGASATTASAAPSASTSPASTAAASPTPAATPAAAAGPAACPTRSLKAKIGISQGTAGSVYTVIDFTNIGTVTCTLYGYPGVS